MTHNVNTASESMFQSPTTCAVNYVMQDGECVRITDLTPDQLCEHWNKQRSELKAIYKSNAKIRNSWKSWVLWLIGVELPTNNGVFLFWGDNHESTIGKTKDGMGELCGDKS